MDIEQICQPYYASPLTQVCYILTLLVVWSYGAFVVWWWLNKVYHPLVDLIVNHGLLYALTGNHKFFKTSPEGTL